MTTYTLTSTKGTRSITGTLRDALDQAEHILADLQPAYGVTISADGVDDEEIRDGLVYDLCPRCGRISDDDEAGGRYQHGLNCICRGGCDRCCIGEARDRD